MMDHLTQRQLAALWFPCRSGEARRGVMYRNDQEVDKVVISTRLTVDADGAGPAVWCVETRIFEQAVLYAQGVNAGEPKPLEMRTVHDDDKADLRRIMLGLLEGVGDGAAERWEEGRYGLILRRPLTAAELTYGNLYETTRPPASVV